MIYPILTLICLLFFLKHINKIEGYIASDFEGKTAHTMTQYVCGHLFTFMDSIMGIIC